MAVEKYVHDESFGAAADLSNSQYLFVELASATTVSVCNNASDIPVGVLQNDPTSGHAATVRKLGLSKVVSDGSGTAIAVGDKVGTNGSGKAVKKTANQAYYAGIARSASTADGVIITVDLDAHGYISAP